jgi:hypothetical protein
LTFAGHQKKASRVRVHHEQNQDLWRGNFPEEIQSMEAPQVPKVYGKDFCGNTN